MSDGRRTAVTLKQLTILAGAAAVASWFGWYITGGIVAQPVWWAHYHKNPDPALQGVVAGVCAAVVALVLMMFFLAWGEPRNDRSPRVELRWLALAGVVVFVALFVVDQLNQRESERLERLQDDRTVEALLAGGFSASDEAWHLATRAHGGRPGWRAAAILANQSASTEVRLMAGFMLVQAGNATPAEKAEVFAMTRRAPPSLRAAGFRALQRQRGNDLNGDINLLFFQGACDPDPEVSAVSREIVGPHPYSCGPQKP